MLTVAMKVFAGPAYPRPTKNIATMMPLASDLSTLPPFSYNAHVMHVTVAPRMIRVQDVIY